MQLVQRLSRVATAILGALLAVTPAALWVAWSATAVFVVLVAAVVSAGLLVLLTESSPQGKDDRVTLPEEFIDEVHRLFPLTYHHSAAGPSRFRHAMKRLRQSCNEAP